jgi:hypothetical protein
LQSVHDRHPDVHQDDVGSQVLRLVDSVGAVGGLADHEQAGLGVEDRGEALSDHRLVVGDQAPCGDVARRAAGGHDVSPSGSTADTTKPPPGAGPAVSEPPSSATRSCIPVSP